MSQSDSMRAKIDDLQRVLKEALDHEEDEITRHRDRLKQVQESLSAGAASAAPAADLTALFFDQFNDLFYGQ